MLERIKKALGKSYFPLNKILISKSNLLSNYRVLLRINPKIKIAPVLKSNAYGHGIVQVAGILDPLGAPFFCVDSIFEAYQLLNAKIKTPILIMGYIDPKNLGVKKLPFAYAVWDLEIAKALNDYQKGSEIHIFVDTGMNREGVRVEELEDFLKELKKLKKLKITGLMSHFASGDEKSNSQTKEQIRKFRLAQDICTDLGIKPKYIHISNSLGLFTTSNLGCNLARVGKALYGIDPQDRINPTLKPVLSLTTKVVQVKKLNKGERVGYDGTFVAKVDMTIGILPIGYNDGVDRKLSNSGVVGVMGKFCKIVGRISMNVMAVDLSSVRNPKVGLEVTIFSSNQTDPNSILNISKLCETIPHDTMVNLVPTTRREVI